MLEPDTLGPLPRANVSVKISALTPLLRPDAPARGQRDAAEPAATAAAPRPRAGAHLHIDMESLDSREAVLELVLELLDEPEFRDGPSAGLVLQAYLRDSPEQLGPVLAWARHPSARRRCRSAWSRAPTGTTSWSRRASTAGRCRCSRTSPTATATSRRSPGGCSPPGPLVRVAIASHNLRSVAHAIAVNRVGGGEDRDLELQVLRGLGDELQHALAARGFRVRTYCPVGDLVAGMAYLVRRLLENTSNESLLSEQARGVPVQQLLAAP